jgi:hypothetical protein
MLVTLLLMGNVDAFNVADYRVRFAQHFGLSASDIYVHSVSDGMALNVCYLPKYSIDFIRRQ